MEFGPEPREGTSPPRVMSMEEMQSALTMLLRNAATARGNDAGRPHKPDTYAGATRGSVPVDIWLAELDAYFDAADIINPHRRVKLAVALLRDTAMVWWRQQQQFLQGVTVTWEQFKHGLLAEFQAIDPERQARDRLRRLRQQGSVTEYAREFRKCLLHIPTMAENDKKFQFTAGLKFAVAKEVAVRGLTTLNEVIATAERLDSLLF